MRFALGVGIGVLIGVVAGVTITLLARDFVEELVS